MVKLNFLVIRSGQPVELSKFYSGLGLRFEYHRHGKGPFHYSAKLVDVVFEIYPLRPEQSQVDTNVRLGFEVLSINGTLAVLTDLGGKTIVSPKASEWGNRCVIEDPEGRKIELVEKE